MFKISRVIMGIIIFLAVLNVLTLCYAGKSQGGEVSHERFYSGNGRWCVVVEKVSRPGYYSVPMDRPSMSELILVSLIDGRKKIVFSGRKMGTNAYDCQQIANVRWSPDSSYFTFISGFLEGTTYYYSYNVRTGRLNLEKTVGFP